MFQTSKWRHQAVWVLHGLLKMHQSKHKHFTENYKEQEEEGEEVFQL